jgi:microcystin-dependent protein
MPRDASGNYTLPLGNPVQGSTVIDVNWANPTMADIATQLNNVFTRDGLLGPLAPWKLTDGVAAAPSMTFNSELGMGLFRESQNVMGVAIGGSVVARFSTTGLGVEGAIGRNGTAIAEVPTGTILDFAGPTAPSGYLLCNGQQVSRTTYAALFAVIGGVWGGGDGSTTFHLPNLQRRVTIGAGGTPVYGPGNVLGNLGGSESAALGATHLPSHTHGVNDPTHAHLVSVSGTSSAVSADHTHNFGTSEAGWHQHISGVPQDTSIYGVAGGFSANGKGGTVFYTTSPMTSGDGAHTHSGTTGGINQNHTHTWSGTFASDARYSGISLQNSGSNAAFGIMPPSVVVNKIIKY